MKVLMLNHNQERFGTYWRCYWLGKYLGERGHEVTLICASGKNFDISVRKIKESQNFTIITLPRIRYHRFLTGQLLRMFFYLYYVLFYPYDIVHAFTVAQPQIGIPAWAAKNIRRKKLIVDWDDLWGGGFAQYHPLPIRLGLSFFETWIPLFADKITVVSEKLQQKALSLNIKPQKIIKIGNGSNTRQIQPRDKINSREKLGLASDGFYIVSAGNTYYSSLDILLESFSNFLEKVPQAVLILVGQIALPDPSHPSFEKVRRSVLITGSVPFNDVPDYLGAADILALPMGNEPIEHARYPIRLGDYLAAGRPIVAGVVGEVGRILEEYHCGLSAVNDSPENYAQKYYQIFIDGSLNQSLSQAALKAAGELSWEKVVDKLEKVYYSFSG